MRLAEDVDDQAVGITSLALFLGVVIPTLMLVVLIMRTVRSPL